MYGLIYDGLELLFCVVRRVSWGGGSVKVCEYLRESFVSKWVGFLAFCGGFSRCFCGGFCRGGGVGFRPLSIFHPRSSGPPPFVNSLGSLFSFETSIPLTFLISVPQFWWRQAWLPLFCQLLTLDFCAGLLLPFPLTSSVGSL